MPDCPAIQARIVPVAELADADREAMCVLHRHHYANVSPTLFAEDLAAKQWVIQLGAPSGRLLGFSTLRVDPFHYGGRDLHVVFSGDTVVCSEARSSSALAASFGVFFTHLLELGYADLHWLLICKGHRTYRFLPVFFREFFPRCFSPDPALGALRDAIADAHFGPVFDPRRGVLDLHGSRDRLLPANACVPPGHRRNPHVRFFLDANPGFVRGDELVCLAPLAPWNLRPAGRRVIARARTVWSGADA